MHARVTTTAIGADETDSVAEIFQQVVPTMRELDGYAGFVVLEDESAQRLLVVSFWETAEAMASSEGVAQQIKTAETAERDFEIQDTDRYRVVTFDFRK